MPFPERLESLLNLTGRKLFVPYVLTTMGLALSIWAIHYTTKVLTTALGLPSSIWLVAIFGALGGAVGGVIRGDNSLRLCRVASPSSVELGVVGDIFQGLGGAAAAIFLFDGFLKVGLEGPRPASMLISVSFLAGVFGRTVIESAGEKLLVQAKKQATEVVKDLMGTPAAVSYTQVARDTVNIGQ